VHVVQVVQVVEDVQDVQIVQGDAGSPDGCRRVVPGAGGHVRN
jgi:hypothetical protein